MLAGPFAERSGHKNIKATRLHLGRLPPQSDLHQVQTLNAVEAESNDTQLSIAHGDGWSQFGQRWRLGRAMDHE